MRAVVDPRFPARLRALREVRRLSQQNLADRTHFSKGYLGHLETGTRTPTVDAAILLDEALDAGGELAAMVVEPTATQPAGNGRLYDDEEAEMLRRHLLKGFAALGAAPLVGLEQVRRDLAESVLGQEHDLAEWEAIVWDYASAYSVTPATALLEDLTTDLVVANTQLGRLSEGDPKRKDLNRVVALLAVFTAQSMGNLGRLSTAARWWRSARETACRSTDQAIHAWVCGRQVARGAYEPRTPLQDIDRGTAAVSHGWLVQAIGLSEATATSRTPSAGTLHAVSGRAQILAVMGRGDEAREALRASREAFERLPVSVSGDTSYFGWSEVRLCHTASFVHTHLGDDDEAERAQDRALTLYTADQLRDREVVRLHQALRLVKSGDPRTGVSHAVRVLSSLPDGHLDGPVWEMTRNIARAVPEVERRRAGVAELREIAMHHGQTR